MFFDRTSLFVVTVKVFCVILICFEQLRICSSISSSSSLPFKVINNTVRFINNKNDGIQNLIPATLTDHICTREENYTEIVKIPTQRTVRVRSSNWCYQMPPRCSSYRTEIREVIRTENVTKTRTIRFCCEGYAGIVSGNATICRPVCRGGCGRGYCYAPDECKCENGYVGRHCTQRCPIDHWGEGCQMKCQCRNNAICDHKNGACRCQSGWIGDKCHIPCPSGFYGSMCKTLCQCEPQECNPQTGQCIFEKTTTKLTIKKELVPFEKISADEMLKSLNSPFNKTEYLAKNLVTTDQVAILVPAIELTTVQPITETVLLITPENPTILLDDIALLETEIDKDFDISKSPEVIHIIDWNQQQLTASIAGNKTNNSNNDNQTHDLSALIMSMIIFSLIFAIILIGFLIFYRQYFFKNDNNNELPGNSNLSSNSVEPGLQKQQLGTKIFIKPLPDLPAFTQNLKKTENVPEFYDCPSNNSAVGGRNLYSYAGPIYTQVPKQYIRKESLDSHLYDEIRYTTKVKSCRV